ncbi:MAG: DNA topoisomerase III, partial [Bacteroidota bacterium]
LKSAELTGQWEKQLRDIENGTYSAKQFIGDMKNMVVHLIDEVRKESHKARIATKRAPQKIAAPRKRNPSPKAKNKTKPTEQTCPKCQQGTLLKGKAAYGCSQWKSGCTFRLPFAFREKTIPEKQVLRLLGQGSTIQLRGFKQGPTAGKLYFDDQFELQFKAKEEKDKPGPIKKQTRTKTKASANLSCPKCKQGQIIKGKAAYGCSRWKAGCDFRCSFEEVRHQAAGRPLTQDLVSNILHKKWKR